MNNITALTCYLPKNLSIESIAGYNKRWHEKYQWLIHTILFKSLTQEEAFGDYTNLQSSVLNKLLGERYFKYILPQLVNAGIIEVNKKYSAGNFARSYRLTEQYRNSGITAYQFTKKTYLRKIEKQKVEYLKDVLTDVTTLHEFQQLTYARIDVEKAIEYIDNNYDPTSRQYKSRLISIHQYDAMHKANFADGYWLTDFTFKVNKSRIYSPVTQLARDLEQFTYHHSKEDESLVCLDMPNSQLCFFNELVKREQYKSQYIGECSYKKEMDLSNTFSNNFGKSYITHHSYTLTPYVLTIGSWEDIIFNGLGYERMMNLTEWKGKQLGHSKLERQEFKAEFFGNLFYNKHRDALTEMEQVFMTHHEEEAKALRAVKKKYGNKLLAVKVQALEAKFFHSIIVDYMRRNHISVPFTIKHDSITLTADAASYILDDLNELVQRFFNRKEIELKVEEL